MIRVMFDCDNPKLTGERLIELLTAGQIVYLDLRHVSSTDTSELVELLASLVQKLGTVVPKQLGVSNATEDVQFIVKRTIAQELMKVLPHFTVVLR